MIVPTSASVQTARNRGRRRIRGWTLRTYRPTGSARSRVSEWLPTDNPNTTAAPTSQRSAVPSWARSAAPPRDRQAAREARDEADGRRGRNGHAQQRQEVDPERLLSEWCEEQVRDEPEQDVGRVAGRMGGAHDRQGGLEFARVPEAAH